MEAVWLLFGALGGAMGALAAWVALEFVGKPIRRFFDLKAEIARQLAVFGNVGARGVAEKYRGITLAYTDDEITPQQLSRITSARDVFRDLSAQMRAFADTETLAKLVLRVLGYDPGRASRAMMSLSNNIEYYGQERSEARQNVQTALKLPD